MKRMMKKLAALALAGAMVLSLSVSALAAPGDPADVTSFTTTGTASGDGITTGGLPQNVIKIKMPTNAASGTFNVYVDPHNMIRQSNNALLVGGSTAETVFADDTLVYFKNTGEGGTVSFSKTSDPIKVINKSNVPVSVGMTATWDKKTSTYTLVKDAADLAASKTAGDAAIYLALEEDHTNDVSAVVETDRGAPTFTPKYSKTTTTESNITSGDLTVLNEFVKGVEFEYLDAADLQDRENINKGVADAGGDASKDQMPKNWAITFAPPTSTSNTVVKSPTVAFSNVATIIPKYKTVSSSNTIQEVAYKATVSAVFEINITQNTDGSKSYSMNANAKPETTILIQRGTSPVVDVAKITIYWDYEVIGANNGALTEKVKKTVGGAEKEDTLKIDGLTAAAGQGAKLETDLNRVDGAYHLGKASDTATTLSYVLNEGWTYDADQDTKWQSVSFRLTAAITDGDVCAKAWDTAFPTAAANQAQMDLTWYVAECDEVDPSATVTTGMSAATDQPVLTIDWGYGAKETDKIKSVTYKSGTATKSLNLDTEIELDGTTLTLKPTSGNTGNGKGIFETANGDITLTFESAKTGYTKDVALNVKADAS